MSALMALGLFAMPGPTLLLMLLLMLPYMLFLASRRRGRLDAGRFMVVACVAVLFFGAFVVLAQSLFPVRLEEITSGNDPSFFYRVRGPAQAGVRHHGALPLRGRRPHGRALHRGRGHEPLCAFVGLFRRLAGRLAGHRAADQLFLAALDLSRNGLGPDHHRRADDLAARAGRAERGLLLDGLGHPGAGVGRLCRPDLLGGDVSGRRRRRTA